MLVSVCAAKDCYTYVYVVLFINTLVSHSYSHLIVSLISLCRYLLAKLLAELLHTPLILENSEGNRSKIPILFFARICMK